MAFGRMVTTPIGKVIGPTCQMIAPTGQVIRPIGEVVATSAVCEGRARAWWQASCFVRKGEFRWLGADVVVRVRKSNSVEQQVWQRSVGRKGWSGLTAVVDVSSRVDSQLMR